MDISICKHCNASIKHDPNDPRHNPELWYDTGMTCNQYCWIDPVEGSQLHEPYILTKDDFFCSCKSDPGFPCAHCDFIA